MSNSTDTPQSGPGFIAAFMCTSAAVVKLSLDQFPTIQRVRMISNINSVNFPNINCEGVFVECSDQQGFDAYKDRFLQFLQHTDPNAAFVWSGLEQQDLQHPSAPIPWYQPFAAKWAIVASVVGAFGVVDAARNHWLEFFEAPEIVAASPNNTVNVLNDDPWKLEFPLKNVARGIDCSADVERIVIAPPLGNVPAHPVKLRQKFPTIKSGSVETLAIERSHLPESVLTLMSKSPGEYHVTIHGTTKGGYLRCTRPFQFSRTLRMWGRPSAGTAKILPLTEPRSRNARLQIPILVGKSCPSGLTAQVTMLGCEIKGLQTNKPLTFRPIPTYNNTSTPPTTTITWQTKAAGPSETYFVELALSVSQPLDQKGWEDLLKSSKLEADFQEP